MNELKYKGTCLRSGDNVYFMGEGEDSADATLSNVSPDFVPNPARKYELILRELAPTYALYINLEHGGIMDRILYNGINLTSQGNGGAFQMACFDETVQVNWAKKCDASQDDRYNPTQAGSCGGASRVVNQSRGGLSVALCPMLYSFEGPGAESDMKWNQDLYPVKDRPNHYQLKFHSRRIPTGEKPNVDLTHAHGKYSNYCPPECHVAYYLVGDTVRWTEYHPHLLRKDIINGVEMPIYENFELRAPGWCILGTPDWGYGFGLKRKGFNQRWAIMPTPWYTMFGQGQELMGWNKDVYDDFEFAWGPVSDLITYFL